MKEVSAEVCIVGLGPAGLGCALALSEYFEGGSVACLEAGPLPSARFCTILQQRGCRLASPCQIIGGVGGSAVLSGGKISDYPAGRGLGRCGYTEIEIREALSASLDALAHFIPIQPASPSKKAIIEESERYAEAGVGYRYYAAHRYRREDLIGGVEEIVKFLRRRKVMIQLERPVSDIEVTNSGFEIYSESPTPMIVRSAHLVLAVGRLGASLVRRVAESLRLQLVPRPYDLGVRLEFPRRINPHLCDTHNDLKLTLGRARTFCVCDDGALAPYRLNGVFLLEGFSDPDLHTGLTNLGVTVRMDPKEHGSAEEQVEAIEAATRERGQGRPLRQTLTSFLGEAERRAKHGGNATSIRFWRWGDIRAKLPKSAEGSLVHAVRSFSDVLVGPGNRAEVSVFYPELDGFWPRINLRRGFQAELPGLFVIGDASGLFRGILQAFASGWLAAQRIGEGV